MSCISTFILRTVKIPVFSNAPVLSPSAKGNDTKTWPLVVFSHGLAGQRTTYRSAHTAHIVVPICTERESSHLCARIASTGKVVVAMEHRDGSGTFCYPKSPETGERDFLLYIKAADTSCVLTIFPDSVERSHRFQGTATTRSLNSEESNSNNGDTRYTPP